MSDTSGSDEGALDSGMTKPFKGSMAHVPLEIDIKKFEPLKDLLAHLRKQVTGLSGDFDKLATSIGGVVGASTGGKSAAGTPKPPVFQSQATGAAGNAAPQAIANATAASSTRNPGGGAGLNSGGNFGGFRSIANLAQNPALVGIGALGVAGARVVGAMDDRIDRGIAYASSADKLSVLTQQITGMSQRQVMNTRKPLANYRLGAGGINQMMAFQASTGVAATSQFASSIAGISAATGYSKSTGDILADQRALMDPTVANRMFNQLGGVNAYGLAGKAKDPMLMRQQIVQRMGLTNSTVLRGAAGPGSVTRARLTQAGVPQEMQDDIIQYAQENQTFQKKGGKGMYDPSKSRDRKKMGIEDNLATQQQETSRQRVAREEQFMSRQIDNMSIAEKQNQLMITTLGHIEDILSGAFGARTSGRSWMNLAGKVMQVGGMALAATGVGALAGVGIAAAGTVLAGKTGDPVDASGGGASGAPTISSDSTRDASINIPTYGAPISLNALKGRSDFKGMNPKMQERLLAMFRAHPSVGWGGGTRSTEAQRAMFLSRYTKTNKKTNIFFEGAYWDHTSGAAAAPPGRSMHEIGLAADLVGDLGWMNANAGKFGLKHFAGVNSEPWHVQPSELPNSRRDYEEGGSTWGGAKAPADTTAPAGSSKMPDVLGDASASSGGGGGGGVYGISTYGGMSIAQVIDAIHTENMGRLGSGGGHGRQGVTSTKAAAAVPSKTLAPSLAVGSGGALSGSAVATLAYNAGFRGDDLVNMVAIAKRESGWRPRAMNPNLATGDQSYGLWQLNTLNSQKGGQMGTLVTSILNGMGIQSDGKNFDALYDPATNAAVAYQFYKRNGNTLRPWGGYKGVSDTHDTNAQAALEVVKGTFPQGYGGDPMPADRGGGGSGGVVHVSSSPQINVAPVINFYGTPQTPDLIRIANQVGQLLKDQARTMEMRSA